MGSSRSGMSSWWRRMVSAMSSDRARSRPSLSPNRLYTARVVVPTASATRLTLTAERPSVRSTSPAAARSAALVRSPCSLGRPTVAQYCNSVTIRRNETRHGRCEVEYDVVIVGTRVAGAATAMLLARQGLRVLAVDRARFPSDTISSHQLQVPGVALLRQWGLLDKLIAAGTPPTRRVRFDAGDGLLLNGQFPAFGGVDALYSPRRTLFDSMLVEAARAAGADVRENFRVIE